MRCHACDAPLDGAPAFPGGALRCGCGAQTTVPAAIAIAGARSTAGEVQGGPYRAAAPRPPEATLITCPYCGAPCTPDARACPHCDVVLASVRCARCFALHFAGARFCARCGDELAPEPRVDASDAPCPRCETPLLAGRDGLSECAKCGGVFVDHAVFAQMATELEAHPITAFAPPPSGRSGALDAVVRYLPCPVCSERMNRSNFGRRSGVVVDMCKMHGIWFDAGELTRVCEWVAAGGLADARRRRRQDANEASDACDANARALAELRVAAMQDDARATARFTDGLESADMLVSILRYLFTKE